jgi:AcrR family transcriptional regulator
MKAPNTLKKEVNNVLNEPNLSFRVLENQYSLSYHVRKTDTKKRILLTATFLFCLRGYGGVSMRDISNEIGLTAGAVYNHYRSKADLWDAVLDHTMSLYLLYHDNLGESLKKITSFEMALDIMLEEPAKMRNEFTCYAFSLILTEQFRNKRAGELFTGTFLDHSISFCKKWFDICVQRGYAQPFDTNLVATLFVHSVMITIPLKVHAITDKSKSYDIEKLFNDFKRFIMETQVIADYQ